MPWETIASIQKSKLVKGVAIWFLIVPILAKFIESEKIQSYIPADLGLPFSWGFFYIASTAFFISFVIYSLKSPEIIKNYTGLDDYLLKNGSTQYLKTLFIKIIKDKKNEDKEKFILKFLSNDRIHFSQNSYLTEGNQCSFKDLFKSISPFDKNKNIENLFKKDEDKILYQKISKEISNDWKSFILREVNLSREPNNENLPEYFSYLREIASTNNSYTRWVISILYIIGFVSLAYVAYENILFVFNYYIK